MKRATLIAYPTTPAAPPADLTDRLLASQPEAASAKRERKPAAARRANRQTAAPAPEPSASAPAASALDEALAAVESASEALRQASQQAPARYDVALHYRLDALAHHLQQVREFVTAVCGS